jgi:hypothetical protein
VGDPGLFLDFPVAGPQIAARSETPWCAERHGSKKYRFFSVLQLSLSKTTQLRRVL